MRIVNWKEFASLSNGTLFSYCGDSSIYIKGETLFAYDGTPKEFLSNFPFGKFRNDKNKPIDFYCVEFKPTPYKKDGSWSDDEDAEVWDLSSCRDGLFEYNRQFLIYDREMINSIIELLKTAKADGE